MRGIGTTAPMVIIEIHMLAAAAVVTSAVVVAAAIPTAQQVAAAVPVTIPWVDRRLPAVG